MRRGERRTLAAPAGFNEVSRIGATLAQVVDHLQAETQALQTLNTELDQRVAERTRRIERMAEEARHAAVTRERLRTVEEALRNIERHADARTVTVSLRSAPGGKNSDRVSVDIADEGVGFDPAAPRPGHYGLRGMHEQAGLIGATGLCVDCQRGLAQPWS